MKATFTPDLTILLLGVLGFGWLVWGVFGGLLLVGCVLFVSFCFGFCLVFCLFLFFSIIC